MLDGCSGPKGRSCGPARSYGEAKAVTSARAQEPSFTRTEPRAERSKNGSHSPVREGARLPGRLWITSQRSSEIRLNSSVARCHRKKPTEHLHLPAFRARTNREHCPMLGSRPAVEKHDGARQGGDLVPTLGLGSLGQAHISRRASWPVA